MRLLRSFSASQRSNCRQGRGCASERVRWARPEHPPFSVKSRPGMGTLLTALSGLTVAQYLRDTWPMVRRNSSDCPGLRIALLSGDVWISCSRNNASSPRRNASYRW